MSTLQKKRSPWIKRILLIAVIGIIVSIGVIWYLFNLKYDDTKDVKADFTVSAIPFINEFKTNEAEANKKRSLWLTAAYQRWKRQTPS
jgi:hypothetical protein